MTALPLPESLSQIHFVNNSVSLRWLIADPRHVSLEGSGDLDLVLMNRVTFAEGGRLHRRFHSDDLRNAKKVTTDCLLAIGRDPLDNLSLALTFDFRVAQFMVTIMGKSGDALFDEDVVFTHDRFDCALGDMLYLCNMHKEANDNPLNNATITLKDGSIWRHPNFLLGSRLMTDPVYGEEARLQRKVLLDNGGDAEYLDFIDQRLETLLSNLGDSDNPGSWS